MARHLLLVALLIASVLGPARAAQAAPRCFAEVPDCVDGRLRDFWERQGGLAVFGLPLGPEREERTAAGVVTAQVFERARLELHPQNAPPYDVQLGRAGVEALERQGRDWTTFPTGDRAAPHFFPQTGHAIAPEFWGYWSSHGLEFDGQPGVGFAESLALFGLPISGPQRETSPTDGQTYLVQWFERARFEFHPEHAGTSYVVLLGLLQRELAAAPQSAPALQQPAASSQAGGFIRASGNQLTRLGQPVQLKGVNYYPQWRPWAEMWWRWDGPQVARELRLARDQLGINAVRVLVPYNFRGEHNGLGKTPPELIGRLRELAQIAGDLDMRLIVTLFDFYANFEAPGSPNWERDVRYARAVVGAFANDERIFAWDLHNEPDHYGMWREGNAAQVLDWLAHMADVVHAAAPNQLVTVGMGQHKNLWLPGPDGRRVIDYSDVVSVHLYDAGSAARQLDELRAQTDKPILVEEFGWPSDPPCVAPNYTEAVQAQLYRDILTAARDRTVGAFAWTLRDYDFGPTARWDHREEHFGLYRADNSLKPAALELRAFPGPPLPSATTSALPLTTTSPTLPEGGRAPLLVPGTPYHVKGAFRRAWELLGGQASFGLPLSNATEHHETRKVVQYFEYAVLELHPEAAEARGYLDLAEIDQVRQLVRPQAIEPAVRAAVLAPGKDLPLQGQFRAFYDQVNGSWRLGQPVSPEQVEQIDGAPTRVQYFERGRLELREATSVEFGRLGQPARVAACAQAAAR